MARPAAAPAAVGNLRLVDGEVTAVSYKGRCGLRAVTLVVTNFRVAIAGRRRVRWLPLEEITQVFLTEDRSRLIVEAWVQRLVFHGKDAASMDALHSWLVSEKAIARRSGGLRHHADVMESWWQMTTNWRGSVLRRVIQRHPALML